MRCRIEAKLQKAVRRAEHHINGLHATIARRERAGIAFAEALCQMAVDPSGEYARRNFAIDLLWETHGAEQACLSMVKLAAQSGDTKIQAGYLSLCSNRKKVNAAELGLFQQVLTSGSPEEQTKAIYGLSFLECRPIRRAFIEIMLNASAPLEVRVVAAEMLHLQAPKETVAACARALSDPDASIRFWAAYTLGTVTAFRSTYRVVAASALERVLGDEAIAPGWWSVGREAQAMIVGLRNIPDEREGLQAEIRRVEQDPTASTEERRWAECYCAE